jgi:hypothetical protein
MHGKVLELRGKGRQTEAMARHRAGLIAGLTRAAHVGPLSVNAARRCDADLAEKSAATLAIATHAAHRVGHEFRRQARDIGIILKGEARPVGSVGAARSARVAGRWDGGIRQSRNIASAERRSAGLSLRKAARAALISFSEPLSAAALSASVVG